MVQSVEKLQTMFKALNMYYTADNIADILEKAVNTSLTCEKFLKEILEQEIAGREKRKLEKRLKQAQLPEYKTLSEFKIEEQTVISQRQINQLGELAWLEQGYNLVFLGPPGVGKTLLSVGIGIEAINNGYKVIFYTMADLIHILKTQEISSSSRSKVKRIIDSDLLIIDDLMFIAMEKQEANLFFQLVNKLYGQTSIIITSNKGPEDWGELMGDPAITTAILDRIVHRCEIVNFHDNDSYRLKHRQNIFNNFN